MNRLQFIIHPEGDVAGGFHQCRANSIFFVEGVTQNEGSLQVLVVFVGQTEIVQPVAVVVLVPEVIQATNEDQKQGVDRFHITVVE